MKAKLSDTLIKNYPLLYKEGMYFECQDGWFDLINDVSLKLEKLIDTFRKEYPEHPIEIVPYAIQVKEKYGTLRFYMSTETDAMSDVINEAEERSYNTCETCGKAGRIRQGAWVMTLCDDCASS
jgi:hypothetical protein